MDYCFQARVKHDTTNTVVAGYVTGGALSAKGNQLSPSVIIFSLLIYSFDLTLSTPLESGIEKSVFLLNSVSKKILV